MNTKPEVKLIGEDGNAFTILGRCQMAAKKAGWSKEQMKDLMDEMTRSDYDHLLQVAMENFEVM